MTEKSDQVEVMARAMLGPKYPWDGLADDPPGFEEIRHKTREKYRAFARAALAAAESAGMVMVPKVPTEAMKRAFYDGKDERKQGVNCQIGNSGGLHSRSAELAWRFMIEAASLQEKP